MNLVLLHFDDRDYEIAQTDEDWHPQRSVPVVWDDENDRPDITKTLEELYACSPSTWDNSRCKGGGIVAYLRPDRLELSVTHANPYTSIAARFVAARFWEVMETT